MFEFELTQREAARLEAAQAAVVAAARDAGITIQPEAAQDLPSVRLAVLTSDALDTVAALRELKANPDVAKQVRANEVAAALANGESALHKELGQMTREQRLTAGHKLEANKPAPVAETVAPEIEAERIRLLSTLPPGARMQKAREWGLI